MMIVDVDMSIATTAIKYMVVSKYNYVVILYR